MSVLWSLFFEALSPTHHIDETGRTRLSAAARLWIIRFGVANWEGVGNHKFSGLLQPGNCQQEYGFSRQAVLTDPYPLFDL
jgi:hypothetical protein